MIDLVSLVRSLLVLAFCLSVWSTPAAAFDQSHKLWTEVLKRYMTPAANVRYASLQADLQTSHPHPFADYLRQLQAVSEPEFSAWPPAEQKAFLINAYTL